MTVQHMYLNYPQAAVTRQTLSILLADSSVMLAPRKRITASHPDYQIDSRKPANCNRRLPAGRR